MIEGITNTKDNLNAITAFVHGISTKIPIERINFNPLTENNYKKLGIPYTLYNN